MWDIAKYKGNIVIHLQNMEIKGQFPYNRAKT